MRKFGGPLVVAGALSLLVAGCGLIPGPGAGIAERIRAANSPIIREVEFSPASPVVDTGEYIFVFLNDDATDAQALDLWCTVVIPAGAEQLSPGRVRLLKGDKLGAGGVRSGMYGVLTNPVCP